MPELCTQELIADTDDVKLLQKYHDEVRGGLFGGEREVFFTPDGKLVDSLLSLHSGAGQFTVQGRKDLDAAVKRFFDVAAKAIRAVHGKLPDDWERLLDGSAAEVKAVLAEKPPLPQGKPGSDSLAIWFRHNFLMYEELSGMEVVHFATKEARTLLPEQFAVDAEVRWPKELTLRFARNLYPRGGGVLVQLRDSSIKAEITSRIRMVDEDEVRGSLSGEFHLEPADQKERGQRESYRPFAWSKGKLAGDFVWDRRQERFIRMRIVAVDAEVKSTYAPPRTQAINPFVFAAELLPPADNTRSFDAAKLDPKKWGLSDEEVKRLAVRFELGKLFFEEGDQKRLVRRLEELKQPADAPIEVAWVVAGDGRCLVVRLSRSLEQLRAMTADEFATYRKEWTLAGELEYRRFHPWPGTIKGYGGEEQRQAALQTTRDLVYAQTKKDFLAAVKDRVSRGHVTLLFVPRGGQGATMYGLPFDQIEQLTDEQFPVWRKRFLRWVEVHTPGQSQVRQMAEADDDKFQQMYAESKAKFGGHDVGRALKNLQKQTGIELRPPDYSKGEVTPVVAALARQHSEPPAALQPGDRILRVEAAAVAEWDEFIYCLSAYRPGSIVALAVQSGDENKETVRYLSIRDGD